MATAYEIKGSGEGRSTSALFGFEDWNRLFYVEVDLASQFPIEAALQTPSIVGAGAVPYASVHPENEFIFSDRYRVERWLQQKVAPFRAIVRIDYIPPLVIVDNIIAAGWGFAIRLGTETELRYYDLDGQPIGATAYDVIPPDIAGPGQFTTQTLRGLVRLQTEGGIKLSGHNVNVRTGEVILRKYVPTLTEAQLLAVTGGITEVNSGNFFGAPGAMQFMGANISPEVSPGALATTVTPQTPLQWLVELVFTWRPNALVNLGKGVFVREERERYVDDEGNTSDVVNQKGEIVVKGYRDYDSRDFDGGLLSHFN